jgi:hypothetical protein
VPSAKSCRSLDTRPGNGSSSSFHSAHRNSSSTPWNSPTGRESIQLARLEQQRAAVLLRADALGTQPPLHRGPFRRPFRAVEHGDRGEAERRQEVEAGIDHVADRSFEAAVMQTLAHVGGTPRRKERCQGRAVYGVRRSRRQRVSAPTAR